MGNDQSPKTAQEHSVESKPSAPQEQASKLPTYPITEDTPGIYFEKVTSGRP